MFPHNSHYTAYEVSLQDSGPLTWAPPSQPTERTAALPPRHAPGFQAGFRGSVRSSEMYSRLRSRAPLTLRQLSVCSFQGYLFPSKPFSFNTCKYTKPFCVCQGICLYILTTYCDKVFCALFLWLIPSLQRRYDPCMSHIQPS